MKDFKGKVVLITGGAGGIGQALTREFLRRGSKVSICDFDETGGKAFLKLMQDEFGQDKVMFNKCDVTKDEDFEGAYNECEMELGTIDILINNAGILSNEWKMTMDVNVGGVIRGTELALKRMGKHNGGKGGHVVNTASIAGVTPFIGVPFYCASKAAVIHYTRCAGDEFHQAYTGVSIQCICPYAADTPLMHNVSRASYTPQCDKDYVELAESMPKLPTNVVAEAFIKILQDGKPGSALVVNPDVEIHQYCSPASA